MSAVSYNPVRLDLQYTPTLNISEKHYEADNITVTVQWVQQDSVTYAIHVFPLVPIVVTASASHQLTIPYNTEYNLSVEAVTPCRPNATASIGLKYGMVYYTIVLLNTQQDCHTHSDVHHCTANCGCPELSSTCGDSIPKVLGYDGLPIEGNIIRLSCPLGMILIGPNSTTCTGNGEWEPDPNGLLCRGI